MWPPALRGKLVAQAVMTVGRSSRSNGPTLLRFLEETAWPVARVVVRLSKCDAIAFDSRRWEIKRHTLAEVAEEMEQYITAAGANVEATIVAYRTDLGWSQVTTRFLH
jgi:hypothetical protein